MRIRRMTLSGYVHNNPERKIQHISSYPLGLSEELSNEQIRDFKIAFDRVEVDVEYFPI